MSRLEYDPFHQQVTGGGSDLTARDLFEAGRGAPIAELEPAAALALSLTRHPEQIGRLGAGSAGTAEYSRDPQLRELVHRHLLSALAVSGTLPPGWQRLAHHMGAGWDSTDLPARLHAQAAARTFLGVPRPTDRLACPPGPAAVIGEIAFELLTPLTAAEAFPSWLARLGPLVGTAQAAEALVGVFERIPRNRGFFNNFAGKGSAPPRGGKTTQHADTPPDPQAPTP